MSICPPPKKKNAPGSCFLKWWEMEAVNDREVILLDQVSWAEGNKVLQNSRLAFFPSSKFWYNR